MATTEEIEEQESGGLNVPYLLGVVRRRHMVFLLPLLAGWLAVWGVSWMLAPRYRSGTTILVEQPTMPKDYVTPNVSDDTQNRLENTTQQILSRARLLRIINQTKLYTNPEGVSAADDQKVDRMRKDIAIELVHTGQSNEVTSFTISFSASTPRIAQQVTGELTNLFINESLETRQQESEGTTKFLEDQVATARKSLEEQEEKIRQFKGQHVGELPTQVGSNLQILAGLQSQLQAEEDALNTAKQQRAYLETMVGQYRTLQGPSRGPASGAAGGLAAVDAELDKLKAQLADLSSRYTDKHPDVRKMKDQIAKEEKTRDQIVASMQANKGSTDPDAAGDPGDQRDPSPLTQLQGQLHANKLEILNRERATAELKTKIADYQSRLNQEPVREQQLSDLTRGYDQSKANYDELLKKKNDSAMATSMELLQQGGRFKMVDPPNLPVKPDFPDHLKFCGIGLGVGLVLGLLAAGTFEFFDDRIHDEKELQDILPVAVMSEIPAMTSPADQEKERRRMWLGWATAAAVSFAILLGSAISLLHG